MAMKDGKLAKNDDFIKTILGAMQQKADSASSAGKKYDEYLVYVKLVRYFDGLTDITKQKETLAKLEASAAVKQKQKEIEYSEKKELYLQSEYMKSLQEKDARWWKAETAKLNEFVKKSQNTDEKHLTVRILEYLSLAAYSTANALMQQNRLDEAARYIELYSIIDSDNPEYAYMFATLYLRKGEKEKSLTSLEKAVELGFMDLSRLQNDTSFTKIRTEEKYLKIVEKLSATAK
jgi:tetratricopeptide (TPR) repeat protein